jgi:hypothetical protein
MVLRDHVLSADNMKYNYVIQHILFQRFHLPVRVIESAFWPTEACAYETFDKITENPLDQRLVTIHSNERFVSSVCLPLINNEATRPRTLFVQSPCGSGKSKFGVAYACRLNDFKLLPNGIFLPVATKAQASAHSAAFKKAYPEYVFGVTHPRELNILHYKNSDTKVSDTCRVRQHNPASPLVTTGNLSAICTINSLVKHYTYRNKEGQLVIHVPSFVWLDEIVSVLDALTTSEHMRHSQGGREYIITVFEHILRHCTYLLCTDAFLNTECVRYIQQIRGAHDNTIVQFDSRFRVNDVYIHHNSVNEFLHHLAESIKANKKVFVLSDSKALATKAHNGMLEIDDIGRKFQYYSAETSDATKDHDFANCSDVWVQYDGIVSTPALTTGVDFTTRHFDQCFVFASGLSITARTNMQMVVRVRNYVDAEIHAYLPARQTYVFPMDSQEEANELDRIVSNVYYETVISGIAQQIHVDANHIIQEAPIAKLAISYAREHDTSRRDYANEFAILSRFSGYRVHLGIPGQSLLEEEDTDMVVQNSESMIVAHVDKEAERFARLSALVMPEELPKQTARYKLTEHDNEVINMYKLRRSIGMEYAAVVPVHIIEKFYDKTAHFEHMRFLGYVCELSGQGGYMDDRDEPMFYKRLNPHSQYFVWALRRLTETMRKYKMLNFQAVVRKDDMVPFSFGVTVPLKNREMEPADEAYYKRCYPAFCKQFGKIMTKDEGSRTMDLRILRVLYTSAMCRMGISIRQDARSKGVTRFKCIPGPQCELYIAKMLNLKKQGKRVPSQMNMLYSLAHFTRHANNHALAFTDIHQYEEWVDIYENLFE